MSDQQEMGSFEYIPKRYWYMDPVYRAFAKLYVADILQMMDYPTGEGAFAYKNHPIYKVDIVGWVVRVEEKPRMHQYGVDDGTGVINCCCWKPKETDNEKDGVDDQDQPFPRMDLGDTIHVKGRVKRYWGKKEVSASYFKKLEDPACASEIYNMEELPRLYKSCYDPPFILPSHALKELRLESLEKETGLKREAQLIDRLYDFLRSYLDDKSNKVSNFYLNELQMLEPVMEIASGPCLEYRHHRLGNGAASLKQIHSVIRQAVQKLDREGFVCCSGIGKDMYEVVREEQRSRLDRKILKILRKDCRLKKYENGCHYLHVMDRLRASHFDFRNITADTVRLTLTRLEERSEVISTTNRHFMLVD